MQCMTTLHLTYEEILHRIREGDAQSIGAALRKTRRHLEDRHRRKEKTTAK